ncbi:thiamine pyrophosphate-dependent enzyme [Anaerotignum sp.]|uniref:thiamine pyrophosphate-dependent enzyme n=1 Tax=Anaerotignum sp. TaxID=2039241 RepID=UPI003735F4FB
MNKFTIAKENCKACGLCAAVCPKNLLGASKEFNSKGYNFYEISDMTACIGCGLCYTTCPEAAIKVERDNKVVASRPNALMSDASTYCPGCSHGIVQRVIAEIIDEENLREDTVGVTPIGCAIFIYKYMDLDFVEGAHGRAPAVATGVKRALSEKLVFTYQGDGDITAIGISEVMHAAIRNENICVIFVNNGIYGMTGGQTAPTTLIGQVTASSPKGKRLSDGTPVHMCEIISSIGGNHYLARGAVDTPAHIKTLKEYIRKAFLRQKNHGGFSMIEILGTCPSGWKMDPVDAAKRITEEVIPVFPLGEIQVPKEV